MSHMQHANVSDDGDNDERKHDGDIEATLMMTTTMFKATKMTTLSMETMTTTPRSIENKFCLPY